MRHAHTPIGKLIQLSDILGVTLYYFVMRTRDQKQPFFLHNVRLIERLRGLEGFDSDDQEAIIKVIDAMIVKQRVESAVAPLDQQLNENTQDIQEDTMQPAKQEALETIGKLPDDGDMDEIMYRLYVLDKIRKSQEAADQGGFARSEDLKREIDTW